MPHEAFVLFNCELNGHSLSGELREAPSQKLTKWIHLTAKLDHINQNNGGGGVDAAEPTQSAPENWRCSKERKRVKKRAKGKEIKQKYKVWTNIWNVMCEVWQALTQFKQHGSVNRGFPMWQTSLALYSTYVYAICNTNPQPQPQYVLNQQQRMVNYSWSWIW